jgi:hypothetical protein
MAACLLTTLTSCAQLKVQEQVKPIQANLLAKCPQLTKHEGTTGAMVIQTMISWASQYNDCAAKHNALVDVVSKEGK